MSFKVKDLPIGDLQGFTRDGDTLFPKVICNHLITIVRDMGREVSIEQTCTQPGTCEQCPLFTVKTTLSRLDPSRPMGQRGCCGG